MKKILLSAFVCINTMVFAQITTSFIQNTTTVFSKAHQPNNKSANPPVWGVGATAGVADGEFLNAFVQSTTASGYDPNSWTALSVNDNGGATTPGAAFWIRTTGSSQGAYGVATINSPSGTNGYGLFDSDFMDNAGTQGAFGTGTSPSTHRGELISPRIDLTGYTNEQLEIKFYSHRRYFVADALVSFSVDDGATWVDIDVNTVLPTPSNTAIEDWVTVLFPNITNGVANLTQCRVRFVFNGEYYYYMVDDLSISITDHVNLTIEEEDAAGNTLESSLYYSSVTNNRYFPLSQLNAHHFNVGANVKNLGSDTILPVDGAKLWVTIEKNQAGNWTQVHNQALTIDSIFPNVGRIITGTLSNTSWANVGQFRTRYLVEHTLDADITNDTLYQYFDLNNNEYASKVAINNNEPQYNNANFPGGSSFADYEYGSMFEFSSATSSSIAIDSVSFIYYVPSSYSGTNYTISVKIYQFIDGSNGGTADGRLDNNGNELVQVGEQLVTLTNLNTATGTYGKATVSNFVNPFTGNSMAPMVDGYYLVALENLASYNGVSSFTSSTALWFGVSESENYTFNMNSSSSANVIANTSPTKVLDASGFGDWNWLGFGADVVPSIGVHLSGVCNPLINTATTVTGNTIAITTPQAGATYQWINCTTNSAINGETSSSFSPATSGIYAVEIGLNGCTDISACENMVITGVNDINNSTSTITMFPNPTNGKIIFTTIEKIERIDVLNLTGKKMTTFNNINTIDISNLASGIYFVKVITVNQQVIKRIVKQ